MEDRLGGRLAHSESARRLNSVGRLSDVAKAVVCY
jgi:hypothetical protein